VANRSAGATGAMLVLGLLDSIAPSPLPSDVVAKVGEKHHSMTTVELAALQHREDERRSQ
jgi:hypothetical protein